MRSLVLAALAGLAVLLAFPGSGASRRRAGAGIGGRLARRARASAAVSGRDVAALAGRLAALSRAGLTPQAAWAALAAHPGPPGPPGTLPDAVAAAVSAGLPASAAVRSAARAPAGARGGGSEPLYWLSIALDVCERAGSPLAEVLDGFAASLRLEEAAAAERAAALAGPRATAAVLAALPLGGVLLGPAAGVNPAAALLGTPAGRACLAGGVLLWAAGLGWTRRLLAAAADPRDESSR